MTTQRMTITIKNASGETVARFVSTDVALIAAGALAAAYNEEHTVENSREVLYVVSPFGHVA